MGQIFPTLFSAQAPSCRRGVSICLMNNDTCRVNNWVLFKSDASSAVVPGLGRVKEIVVLTASATTGTEQLIRTVVLLQHMDIGACVEPYRMPTISFGNKWVVVDVSVSDKHGTLIVTYTHSPFPAVYTLYCKLPTSMPQPPMCSVGVSTDLPRAAIDRPNTGPRSASCPR
jgi:hypothetical protein